MSVITPSAETVFTNEYWQPVLERPEIEAKGFLPVFQGSDPLKKLCAHAAISIFNGEGRERAPEGTVLDYSSDNQFIQPGNILLVDTEYVFGTENHEDGPCSDELPRWASSYMESDDELLAAPASLFRDNSTTSALFGLVETAPTVFPYHKTLCDPSLKAHYQRAVELVAVGYDHKGDIAEPERQTQWKLENAVHEVSGAIRLKDILKIISRQRFPLPSEVGQAYHLPDNESARFRIKSVELCFRGSLERATAKKRKLSLPNFAGRLAAEPELA